MDNIMIAGVSITGILGFLAFIVSVIVEVTKELPGIKAIPTQLWCVCISVIVCVVSYITYAICKQLETTWYFCAGAVIASFVVAYISMYGWDTIKKLYERFMK